MRSRDESEAALQGVVEEGARSFLQRILDHVRAAIRERRHDDAQPVLALGVLLGWWTDDVSEQVVDSVSKSWQAAYGVTLGDASQVSARADAMAFHVAAVRDRLSRGALPEIPEAAFDQVRLSQSAAVLGGWDPERQARDIAERLAWEPDKGYWEKQKAYAEARIDKILDPLGKPGTPARSYAHQHDPAVLAWQGVRAQAVDKIREDESDWAVRARRIARTESTAAWNSGALAALADEGRTHKEWVAHVKGRNSDRTRESHKDADGQVVPLSRPFRVGESLLMMPGDPSAPPWETVNCRCTIVGADAPRPTALTAGDAPHFLTASGWRDQLRVPKGNGDRSGRWTYTPWKHLDDLAGLLNALGAGDHPEVREALLGAAADLEGRDPSAFEAPDDGLAEAAGRVADRLEALDPTGNVDLDEAVRQAAAGVREFADTDWTLFEEATDVGSSDGGKVVKNVWEGDLPGNEAVDPAMEGKTSQWLVDELRRIKEHPVAPSPSARRKRASYVKELNDRRDRDATANVDWTEDQDATSTLPAPKDDPLRHPHQDFIDAAVADGTLFDLYQNGQKQPGGPWKVVRGVRNGYVRVDSADGFGLDVRRDELVEADPPDAEESEDLRIWRQSLADEAAALVETQDLDLMARSFLNSWKMTVDIVVATDIPASAKPDMDIYFSLVGMKDALEQRSPQKWKQEAYKFLVAVSKETAAGRTDFEPLRVVVSKRLLPVTNLLEVATAGIEADILTRYGSTPAAERTPAAVVEHVGAMYHVRASNNNCVLASTVYELRRRGMDVHPKRAEKGRNAEQAQKAWFVLNSEPTVVEGLRGRQATGCYEAVLAHFDRPMFPEGSRGTIRAGWKGRNFGHIWNWEIVDGKPVFWDPQTGEEVGPDRADYWGDMDYRFVTVQRLDDALVRPEVEVVLAPPDTGRRVREAIEEARRLKELGDAKHAARLAQEATFKAWHSAARGADHEALRDAHTAAREAYYAALEAFEAYRRQATVLHGISTDVPLLPPEVFR